MTKKGKPLFRCEECGALTRQDDERIHRMWHKTGLVGPVGPSGPMGNTGPPGEPGSGLTPEVLDELEVRVLRRLLKGQQQE